MAGVLKKEVLKGRLLERKVSEVKEGWYGSQHPMARSAGL